MIVIKIIYGCGWLVPRIGRTFALFTKRSGGNVSHQKFYRIMRLTSIGILAFRLIVKLGQID